MMHALTLVTAHQTEVPWDMIGAREFKQEAQLSQRDRATPRVSCNLVNWCTLCTTNRIWKHLHWVCEPVGQSRSSELSLFNRSFVISYYSVMYSNNVSVLHRFWYNTTFSVYLTACDLEKSFKLNKTVEIRLQVACAIRVCSKIWELESFQTAKLASKVTLDHVISC